MNDMIDAMTCNARAVAERQQDSDVCLSAPNRG
jgi:hypothetical protein